MKHIAITLALVVFSAFAFAQKGHEHPETTPPAAPTNHTPVVNADQHKSEAQDGGSDDVAAEGSEYSEFAAHMIFEKNAVHAHVYWKVLPAVNEEAFLQLEFRDAVTHTVMTPVKVPSVSVWNESYGYGLVQPSLEPALDKEGKAIPGTFNVSNIYFLAMGHWEVRVYLTGADGTENGQAFVVDLGDVSPSPACDPNSPAAVMMQNMDMPMPDCSGSGEGNHHGSTETPHDHELTHGNAETPAAATSTGN